ncbi:MAG TPA: CerR family C-terminal domain-containing protein [Verrucomicrobiae bacterium]|nr:CerR family C-terminal domain-containing protein [Verrucomicrobiae bacterium]
MRRRLLEAAGEVFADKGFAKATVRAICDRAGANVAAINYYFQDKEGLYREAIKYWSEISREKYPADFGLGANPTAEQRLGAFVQSFLFRILDASRPGWHGKLLTREMVEPTKALDELVESAYRPMTERLRQIVRELGGGRLNQTEVRLCARSVMGQCLYYRHARPVIARLDPDETFEASGVKRLAAHITRFSVGAIKALARKGGRA